MTERTQKPGRLRPLLAGALLRTQTDARLTALAATGNEPAFTALFERYHAELCGHASRIVRDDRAEDVVQQSMLNAWMALLAGGEVENLRAWLHRIVHNAALSATTRRGYDDTAIPETRAAPSLTEDLADGRLSATQAIAAIAALPEAQRRALTLTAIEGHSGRESALAMGISESALRQLIYRARTGVRQAVSAVIPLPLVAWLAGGSAVTATPAAIGLGAAAGTAATTAKVIAVIGVASATLGATHALQGPGHHHSAPPRVGVIAPVRTTPLNARAVFAAPSAKVAGLQEQIGQAGGNQNATGQRGNHTNHTNQGNNGQSHANSADTATRSSRHGNNALQSGNTRSRQGQQNHAGQTKQQRSTTGSGPNQP